MKPQATGVVETDEEREARVVAEAKANREELAKKGVFATEEFVDAAIKHGRDPMVPDDFAAGR